MTEQRWQEIAQMVATQELQDKFFRGWPGPVFFSGPEEKVAENLTSELIKQISLEIGIPETEFREWAMECNNYGIALDFSSAPGSDDSEEDSSWDCSPESQNY